MPELPEVEVVCRELHSDLQKQQSIVELKLFRKDLRWPFPKNLKQKLMGQKVQKVFRRGKYILFQLPNGFLLSHLGMTGSWRWLKSQEEFKKHDHLYIKFEAQSEGRPNTLVFHDPRRFGVLDWADDVHTHELLKDLGPEPLSGEFSAEYLWKQTRGSQTTIKQWLMNNNNVVGIGNIYASEILFLCKISPLRKAGKVKQSETVPMYDAIQKVLQQAIASGGSTIRDYVSSSGQSGGFQDAHQVYERHQVPCRVCSTLIKQKVISGRSTYWCPVCQKN